MATVGVKGIGLSSVLRPRQHSIGYMGDGGVKRMSNARLWALLHNNTKS